MSVQQDGIVQPFDLVIFGGSGDLTMRKLLPSLYYHHREGLLPPSGRVIGVARRTMDAEQYRAMASEQARRHIDPEHVDEEAWQQFLTRLDYLPLDASKEDDFEHLAAKLAECPEHERVYYLSTGPALFAAICSRLGQFGLAGEGSRIAVEKPLGHDLGSAREINACIGAVFEESQVYRLDHYLGKEPVQNILALRFGNALFEPLWRRGHVRNVQLTVAETIGVEGRGEFYDQTGALRDMVQNHLLQLLCIIAMEPPAHNDPDSVRDEKLKVLRALRPLTGHEALVHSVRGQYRAGAVSGEAVTGYVNEPGVQKDSFTETFVALRAHIDNWRWAGVPFYLRTGKRLQERITEVVIDFEPLPHQIFPNAGRSRRNPNQLVIRLQPEEYIRLSIRAKAPGDDMVLRPVELNLDLAEAHSGRQRSAYERLLLDLLRGRQTLFLRHDEMEAAWRWIDPILAAWHASDEPPMTYNAGTWGPVEASRLVYSAGDRWHEEN
ncbi:MAG: glucose-6-phosphate dehydrogenase [Candidatus Competibacterales bacterium]|nr:glucose-6-phosphate dehydrogenase [Candidatus Competibacterales bacterium]